MVAWQRSQRHVRRGRGCQVAINDLDMRVLLLELVHDRSSELAALRVAAEDT